MRQTIKKLSCIAPTGAGELTLRLRRLEKNYTREAVLQAPRRAHVLALPEDAAGGVLEGIKRQQWEFSQYAGRGEA